MVIAGVPPGFASLSLPPGVSFLNEKEAVFAAMVEGWQMRQRGGRNLKELSVRSTVGQILKFQSFTNEWPWTWTAGDFDEWMLHLVAVKKFAPTTIRMYQYSIKAFCSYLCSEHYGWVEECMSRFGMHPVQVCHEWNTVAHLQDYEGLPGRRPMSREEIQKVLDRADQIVEDCLSAHRKGALPAYRDATMLKVIYGWGLRINEAVHLDETDFYANPHAPEFGRFGVLQVRYGKSSAGSAPKRRSVMSLHPWAVDAVRDYVENVWPHVRTKNSNALWVTERGTRTGTQELRKTFGELRDSLGMEHSLTPHSLRHSYVTHLVESGVDPVFIQQQVGHAYQSTTAIYTAVSGDFANKMMHDALAKLLPNPNIESGAE